MNVRDLIATLYRFDLDLPVVRIDVDDFPSDVELVVATNVRRFCAVDPEKAVCIDPPKELARRSLRPPKVPESPTLTGRERDELLTIGFAHATRPRTKATRSLIDRGFVTKIASHSDGILCAISNDGIDALYAFGLGRSVAPPTTRILKLAVEFASGRRYVLAYLECGHLAEVPVVAAQRRGNVPCLACWEAWFTAAGRAERLSGVEHVVAATVVSKRMPKGSKTQ